jgi:hypothetical protein
MAIKLWLNITVFFGSAVSVNLVSENDSKTCAQKYGISEQRQVKNLVEK